VPTLHDGDGGTHESDEAEKGRENVRRNEASREVAGPTNPHAARAERVRRGAQEAAARVSLRIERSPWKYEAMCPAHAGGGVAGRPSRNLGL
jgi:hypothetical protein